MAKILLVEDDRSMSESIVNWMSYEHHLVEAVFDGKEAIEMLLTFPFDVVILDWQLPGMSGVDILQEYRNSGGNSPVLMLTGKDTLKDKQVGFERGADDYLTKPFQIQELIMRVRALLRRHNVLPANAIQVGDLCVDSITHKVTRSGQDIELTAKEFALLEYLARHPNQVFSNEALLDRVWPSDADVSPETVRVLMNRMRAKIDKASKTELVQNVRGVGYKLQPP